MNISFVVLHYENIVDTRECIESLMQYMHKEDEVHIIIVDNGSIKGKANVIEKEVKNKNIHYIYSPQNLGLPDEIIWVLLCKIHPSFRNYSIVKQ